MFVIIVLDNYSSCAQQPIHCHLSTLSYLAQLHAVRYNSNYRSYIAINCDYLGSLGMGSRLDHHRAKIIFLGAHSGSTGPHNKILTTKARPCN